MSITSRWRGSISVFRGESLRQIVWSVRGLRRAVRDLSATGEGGVEDVVELHSGAVGIDDVLASTRTSADTSTATVAVARSRVVEQFALSC